MRVIVFFDLPMDTRKDIKAYTRFRKMLINEGFFMMQKSVYCKLAINEMVVKSVKDKINKQDISNGLIQVLVITEKQFSKIENIAGEVKNDLEDSVDRLIIL